MLTGLTGAPVGHHVHAIAGQAVVGVVGGGGAAGVHHGGAVTGRQSNAGHRGQQGGGTGRNWEEHLI